MRVVYHFLFKYSKNFFNISRAVIPYFLMFIFVSLTTQKINKTNNAITAFWKWLTIGYAPDVINEHCVTGRLNAQLKRNITTKINKLLKAHGNKHFKFGKTGYAISRVDRDDYRAAPYKTMYLLYESSSVNNVEELEKYYSIKYYNNKFNQNIDVKSLGRMKSPNGKYYLYVVI